MIATRALLAVDVGWGTTLAIKTVVILAIVPLTALILGYVFLLKMMSHMQSRLGPMDPGGFHGWFQLVGDGIKFIQKEDITPARGRPARLRAARPPSSSISTFLVFVVIPAGPDLVVAEPRRRRVLRAGGVEPLGHRRAHGRLGERQQVRAARRAARRRPAHRLRAAAAARGRRRGRPGRHDEPAGHRRSRRTSGSIFGWDCIGFPFILTQFIGFVLFLVAAQAELTQTPFDMPVAESELVGGYMVEYTGFRFLFFFIGEFGTAFAFAALAATLFLGGWALPWIDPADGIMRFLGPACCSPRSCSSRSSCSGCASRTRACVRTSCRRSRGSS